MKARIIHILTVLSVILISVVTTGCRDDFDFDPLIGEGEANLDVTMGFERMFPALDTSTRAAGDAVNKIEFITVVAFNQKGDLYKVWRSKSGDFTYTSSTNTSMPGDFKPEDYDPNDTDNDQHQAEKETPQARFTLTGIPFGRYKFYAVANLDLSADDIADETTLREVVVEWNTDAAKNNAMFGFFTEGDRAGVRPQTFEAPQLIINKSGLSMWAWLKRTVSKVTVAFDGRKLNDNITIYLKDVQIKDIPKYCYIGRDNKPGWAGTSAEMSELIANGEIITYQAGDQYGPSWKATVTRGAPIYGALGRVTSLPSDKPGGEPVALDADKQIEYQHSETAPALYFFENIQKDGEKGTESDKRQDVNLDGNNKPDQVTYPNGNNPSDKAHKDARPYGSYIEVHAYYVDTSSDHNTHGDIIYRFMLGQDDWLDYSALRNRHYKLTMRFNGNANDVDWHIVYNEPEISFPRPYYISYLYNHKMLCPITINAGRSTIDSISARITSNNWAPANAGDLKYWKAMDQPTTYQYNGFLSLRETTATTITASKPFNLTVNEPYYTDTKRGWRVYRNMTEGGHTDDGDMASDKYYVKLEKDKDGNNIYHISLPMYTRAKQMVKQTAYTGNNPYSSYQREAKVKLKIKLSNGNVMTTGDEGMPADIDVNQVRRIENPKGIFRNWDSKRSFHVQLKYRESESDTSFVTAKSNDGPWKAYVVRASSPSSPSGRDREGKRFGPSDPATTEDANGMLTFSGGDKVWKSGNKNVSDTVYGDTGSDIDFTILFNNTCSSSSKSRHAIVRVEYNNLTCYHLIYVRQGGAPVRLLSNGTKWHSGNMISKTQEATIPIDEGSLFKFGNWDWPIASTSNVNGKTPWTNVVPDYFKYNNGRGLTIVGKTDTYNWDDSGFTYKSASKADTDFGAPSLGSARIATYNDFLMLYQSEVVEQGYGALYGDDATGTASTLGSAYGYVSGKSKTYGMRGCFVYNSATGVSVFFPIGNSGYGHRKDNGTSWPTDINKNATRGLLRYSCNGRWGYFPTTEAGQTTGFLGVYPQVVNDCPIFYDIFMRPGAIYWFGRTHKSVGDFPDDGDTNGQVICGWDFNYFSFDFYPLSVSNVAYGGDACFVRCVED